MSIYILTITCGIIAYLIGSNNWAYLIAKINGVDIVKTGTGNPGAANVYREISPIAGISVFIADLFTGSLVFFTRLSWIEEQNQTILLIIASIMIMVGTAYPLFKFKTGGTGLAKCIGIIFAINPLAFLISGIITLLFLLKTKNTGVSGALAIFLSCILTFISSDISGGIVIIIVATLLAARTKIQYSTIFD